MNYFPSISIKDYIYIIIIITSEYPCVATGTYNTMITYIQNVSYIVIKNIS
jgi:hypothetical protein